MTTAAAMLASANSTGGGSEAGRDSEREPGFPDLAQFIAPRSMAMLGISADLSKFGGRVLDQFRRFGFSGRLYLVNPRYTELHGMPCYPSVAALPEVPDHVAVLLAAERVMAGLEDVHAAGCRFATIFTSGFAELGTAEGIALQAQIAEFSRRTGVRFLGPNCNGFINFVDGIALCPGSIDVGGRLSGSLGIVAHSGGFSQVNVMWQAQELGLGTSHLIMCGNDADLDLLDFMNFLVDDPATRVLLVVAERIADGPRFFAVARRAAQRGKPIVMIKAGRTDAGRAAAASHTGAVTGSDVVHDAAFREAGVIRADDSEELYETGMLLATGRWPAGNRAAGLSISGGNVVLLSDLGSQVGLTWPAFTAETRDRLVAMLPSFAKVSNPIDLTAGIFGNDELFRLALEAVASDPGIDVLITVLTHATRDDADRVTGAAARLDKPLAVVWSGTCRDDPSYNRRSLIAAGLPVYQNLLPCVKAVRNAVAYGAFRQRYAARGSALPRRPSGIDRQQARSILLASSGLSPKALTERTSKQVLAAYGFPVTDEALARTAADAVAIAERLHGPVALKIESEDIPHKTESGAIRLNLLGAAAVEKGFDAVVAAARTACPDARIEGVLVQAMAPPGMEIILGVSRDPVFGPVVTAGVGGTQVELLRDVAHGIAPVDLDQAFSMLSSLRAASLFNGWRGTPPRDLSCLAALIERLSWLALDAEELIEELDINPLLLFEAGKGAVVVDALIVPRSQAAKS